MVLYCVSYTEVLKSVWTVIEAVNNCPEFHISYPDSLKEQKQIASEFQAASMPGITNCVRAIHGILIWIWKPSLKESKIASIGKKKFLCGQKHKFGLNC